MRSTTACVLLAISTAALAAGLAGGSRGACELGMSLDEVTGGEDNCWKAGTTKCPATTPSPATCDCVNVGDACGGKFTKQLSPNYRDPKKAATGKKERKTLTTKVCAHDAYCGPQCALVLGGVAVVCPITTLSIFKVEREPDADSGDCDDNSGSPATPTSWLRGRGAGRGLLAANGSAFDCFAVR